MPAPKVDNLWMSALDKEYAQKKEELERKAKQECEEYKKRQTESCSRICSDKNSRLDSNVWELRSKASSKPDAGTFFGWGFFLSLIPAFIYCTWDHLELFLFGYLVGLFWCTVLYFLVWGFMALAKSNTESMIITMQRNNDAEISKLRRETEEGIEKRCAIINDLCKDDICALEKEKEKKIEDHQKSVKDCYRKQEETWKRSSKNVLDWLINISEEVLEEARRTAVPAEKDLSPTVTYTVDKMGIAAQLSTTEYIARTADGGYEKIEKPIWKKYSFVFHNESVHQPYDGDDLIEKSAYASFLFYTFTTQFKAKHRECTVSIGAYDERIYKWGNETVSMLISTQNRKYIPTI